MRKSPVARPTEEPGKKKKGKSLTIPPDLIERVENLQAVTGLSASKIVSAALKRSLPIFEKDKGELLK